MKTHRQLEKHKARVCKCGKKFILTYKKEKADLFGFTTFNQLTPLPLYCKSFFCPNCAGVKRSAYKKRIKNGLSGESWRFLTLTLDKSKYSVKKQFEIITRDWNKLLTVLRYKYGPVKFVRFLEIGKGNNVHVHIIINKYIPKPLIIKYWYKYNYSYIIDISKVRTIEHCIKYCASYIQKSIGDEKHNEKLFLHQKRRVSFSRNWLHVEKLAVQFSLASRELYDIDHLINYLHKLQQVLSCDDSAFNLDYLPNPPFVKDSLKELKQPNSFNGISFNKLTGEIINDNKKEWFEEEDYPF